MLLSRGYQFAVRVIGGRGHSNRRLPTKFTMHRELPKFDPVPNGLQQGVFFGIFCHIEHADRLVEGRSSCVCSGIGHGWNTFVREITEKRRTTEVKRPTFEEMTPK